MRTIVIACVLVAVPAARAADPAKPWATKHRVLFNGDCTFLFYDAFANKPDEKYEKQTLHRFIDRLADCGVDTYLCNPNGQVPWYPSKRTPWILTGYKRGDRDFSRGMYRVGLPKERVDQATARDVLFLNRYLDL